MSIAKYIRQSCTPAKLYAYISVFTIVLLIIQNVGNCGVFQAGSFECAASNLVFIFVGQGLYVAFWTIVLQSLCNAGYKNLSWFVFLFPLLMFFVILGIGMTTAGPPELTGRGQNNGLGG